MKNRNIQFKPIRGVRIAAASRLLCGSVYLGVHSGSSQRGRCRLMARSRCIPNVSSSWNLVLSVHAHVINFGNANQLEAFTGTAEHSTQTSASGTLF